MDKNELVLDINTDTFKELKENFNTIIGEVLTNVVGRNLAEADINIGVHLAFDNPAPGQFRNPKIEHKIKAVFKQTAEKSGSLAPANMELVKDGEKWVLKPVDDGQQDMFDEPEPERQAVPALPEPEQGEPSGYYEPEPEQENVTPSCPKCKYSRVNGQPKTTGPCADCDRVKHTNFESK